MYPARPAAFDYHRAASVDEALSLLTDIEDAKVLAGGHSLLPLMKVRLATPAALVDIGRIPGLADISGNGGLTIGALATHADVGGSEVAIGICPVISETARQIGDRLVRNRGTLGGSVAHADPAADYPTVLKALGATIVATGTEGEREIPADEFFVDVFTTSLRPGELVTSVRIPATGTGHGAAYLKHRHPASSYAVVGVAAAVAVEGGTCTEARVVVGGATGTPVAVEGIADAVVGNRLSDETTAAAAERVGDALAGALADVYASAEYRTHLAGVLVKRALRLAGERAAG
jgi:aerobic carbon-monoxide dehydrogenase medium subunit